MAYDYTRYLNNSVNNPDNYTASQPGSYKIFAYAGDDIVRSFNSNTNYDDYIDGGSGDDQLFSYDGRDQLNGGTGDDYLSGGDGKDKLYGQEDDDTLVGGSGRDFLFGGSGVDELYGQSGSDELNGGSSGDELYGGSGNDRLAGEEGSDYLAGGSGEDKFVFSEFGGNDRVDDFELGDDLICIDKDTGFRNFDDLFISNNGGGDAVIDLGNDGSITVTNILNYQFDESDFKFF